VLNLHLVLAQALSQAVRWGLIDQSPAAGAQPPRPRRPEPVVVGPALASRILAAVQGTTMELPAVVGLATGRVVDHPPHVAWTLHTIQEVAGWNGAPATVEADVMKPLPVDGPFDSAALSFVLHCLRGSMTNKATAVRNIADVLTPDGVLFGGTVLGLKESHTRPARAFLWAVNKKGDFDNLEDTVDGLRGILDASFRDVEIEVAGSAALFSATAPRA
jgi:hypothetical protein